VSAAGLVRHEGCGETDEAAHGVAGFNDVRGGGVAGGRGCCGGRLGSQSFGYEADDKPEGREVAVAADVADVEGGSCKACKRENHWNRGRGDDVPHGHCTATR
jgi:hypothetical protein